MYIGYTRESGRFLVSDTGRIYELTYGHGIGVNNTNDIIHVMDWNTDVPVMVCWLFFDYDELRTEEGRGEFCALVGARIGEYEAGRVTA